jgi:glyoxylase-like metal-dependent hydrolase (beta-lactamase superfamily II)
MLIADADHSGGLMHFIDTDVPIYVHDLELTNALWCLYTRADAGPYQPSYLTHKLNWQTFNDQVTELFPGISMHHCPGHTSGLCCMQIDLPDSGTWIFTGDQFHVKENYTKEIPQGFLGRDRNTWFQSLKYIQRLERVLDAKIMFGHDMGVFKEYKQAPEYYT